MNPIPHRDLTDRKREQSTPEELADQFAAKAVKAVLAPTPDGLAELARKIGMPNK